VTEFIPNYHSHSPNAQASTREFGGKYLRSILPDHAPWKTRSMYCRSSHNRCEQILPGTGRVRYKCGYHGDDLRTCGRYTFRCSECLEHGAEEMDR
jgi:hypothetical protein